MINIILGVMVIIVYSIITFPIKKINSHRDNWAEANYKLITHLAKGIAWSVRLKIFVNGSENIDPNKNYLIICNHKSVLDIVVLLCVFKKPIRFIGKKELKKVPIVRAWFKEIGSVFIDRDNVRQSSQIILQGIDMLKNNKSVVLFPEGERVKDDRIGDFKSGGFKLACKSGVEILPIAIVGMNTALKTKKLFTSGTVKVNIGEAINWKEKNILKTVEISEYANKIVRDLAN